LLFIYAGPPKMNKVVVFCILLLCTPFYINAQVNDSKIDLSSSTDGQEEAAKYSRLLQEYYKNGDYELHKIYSDSLLLISELYGINDMGILALNSQAIYYKNRSNRQKAIEIYHQALEKCELVANNQGPKAMILVNMGNLYTDIGAYEKSIKAMDELLVVTDTIRSFSKIKAAALVGQSTNYIELNEYEKGLRFAERAIALGKYMKDEEVVATSLNNISDIYISLKDYKSALETTEKGLQLPHIQKPTKKRAWLLFNNGVANYHLSNIDLSLQRFKESLTLAENKNLNEIAMYSYEYLAKVYEKKKNFKASYEAQKEYTRIRDLIQGDNQEATIVDLSKDISKNEEIVEATEKAVISAVENKKQLIFVGSLTVLFLLITLFFYIKKKKRIEVEKNNLQEKYAILKQAIKEKQTASEIPIEKTTSITEEQPYKNSSLTTADRERYKERIITLMKTEKPYLDPNLRLGELASKLEMSTSHFSEVLHYSFKENFYNFINFYRVLEAQELMKQPQYKTAKIIAIAFDSGFKSKTTFNRVFKNYTGHTPSEYRKTL